MIRRHSTFVIILLFVVLGLGLNMVKLQIQSLHDKNTKLQRELQHEEATIKLLQAEWMVLNHPKRLQELSSKINLSLSPLRPTQMSDWNGLAAKREHMQKVAY